MTESVFASGDIVFGLDDDDYIGAAPKVFVDELNATCDLRASWFIYKDGTLLFTSWWSIVD